MTEYSWSRSLWPEYLISAAWGQRGYCITPRRWRLLACGLARVALAHHTSERQTAMVEAAENLASRPRLDPERAAARQFVPNDDLPLLPPSEYDAEWALKTALGIKNNDFPLIPRRGPERRRQQAVVVRDVLGYPFSRVWFSPRWRTETAVAIARRMYENHVFDAMPILADALQEAGCESAAILDHCRGPGPHAYGCWVAERVMEFK